MTPAASVIVPAHDEAAVLPALLARLAGAVGTGALDVVVVANGCTDATAQVARDAGVRVVEVAAASKTAALDAGDAAARAFPRIYLDADVVVDGATLLALADALRERPGAAVGAPTMHVDTTGSGWAVRQHYRVWALSEYRRTDHVGSGVYAVNAAGRARWGTFPDVVADDRFVQQRFAPAERLTLPDRTFTVRAPRTLRALLRRGTRIHRGNHQLAALGLARPPGDWPLGDWPQGDRSPGGRTGPGRLALARRVAARPTLWPAFAVYCVGYGLPLLRARLDAVRRAPVTWNRDDTSRGLAVRP
ncbi:glycosyltransferase [Xylanimonas protaetiae]|uniref:4,4'-diaponeurosporenoate glycosyltransferase n=1 Tax=Xylanimonas protaetiae TaxID=2509457 RepID=A0A4P6F8A9_9MICO|nr:glycosyltransferase [Xylanimonas protaetiae]QAY69507.1 glycosyltransferase [Xylanimonas protaetiae]